MNEQDFAAALEAVRCDIEWPLSYNELTGSIVDRSGKEILRVKMGSYVEHYFVDTARAQIHQALVEVIINELSEKLC